MWEAVGVLRERTQVQRSTHTLSKFVTL